MIYYLSEQILASQYGDTFSFLNMFRYITTRTAGAALTSLVICMVVGPSIIHWLKSLKVEQKYKDKAEEAGGLSARIDKVGTPTMGGIMIVLSMDLSALIWAQWNEMVILVLVSVIIMASLGFYDDYVKITQQTGGGISSRTKLIVQILLAGFISFYVILFMPELKQVIGTIMVPFYKYPVLEDAFVIGSVVAVFAIVGSSNAVNITDGLDGLAIGCVLLVCVVFLALTYVAGHANIAGYLQVPFVSGAGELTVFCGSMLGAGLGFWWFNCHPAEVFMGDTGSLALGGALGVVAVLIQQPFVLVIAGGVFVAEAASVMIQTGYFKYTRRVYGEGRRIFRMAPLHHHFEKLGMSETKIVARLYIIGVLLAIVSLATLKIR